MERSRHRKLNCIKGMVSLYKLDLEYLQTVNGSQNALNLVDKTLDAQLCRLQDLSHSDRCNTLVLGSMVWENCNLSKGPALSILESVKNKINNLGAQFHLIAGINYQSQLANANFGVTFINFFALRTYLECLKQPINTAWQYNNKKILFLMGKAYKPHRVGLLYLLYKQGMLVDDKCVWSCLNLDFKETKKFLPSNLTDNQISEFIENCYRVADSAKILTNDNINTHYGGFPFDENLYKTTNISLISETAFTGSPFVTEKTYRAIVNHHPFVIASAVGQNKELQQQGFVTFDEFMTFSEYNEQLRRPNSLSEIVENVKNFDPTPAEIIDIDRLIRQNALRFDQLIQEESSKIQSILQSYGVSQNWQDTIPWEDLSNYFLSWQFYYQIIKDPSWPPCYTLQDCINLPPHIQNELRTVFKVNF